MCKSLPDICANGGDIYSCTGHGVCTSGACACTDGYTGVDCSVPSGGFPYPRPLGSVTEFCQLETGGCTAGMCIGGSSPSLPVFTNSNLPEGITGVAAVNPSLYGSRYAYSPDRRATNKTVGGAYTTVGQTCGQCFKLTSNITSVTVVVVDRCAGQCRATQQGTCDTQGEWERECGICDALGQKSVPVCSCYSPEAKNFNGICNGKNSVICDWCSGNDHAHFDLDNTTFNKLCGPQSSRGHCDLVAFQSIPCSPLKGPWPNGAPSGFLTSQTIT